MSDILVLFFVFMIGILTGFIDSTIGSGGLLSIPSLIFLGLPPQIAIATDRLGMVGQSIGEFIKYRKSSYIQWKYIIPLCVLSLIGSVMGSSILLHVDSHGAQRIIGVILLGLSPFLFLKNNIGIIRHHTTYIQKIIGFLLFLCCMIFEAFFGTGAGVFIGYTFLFFFGFTLVEIKATNVIPWFVLSVSSLIIFSINNLVDYTKGISFVVGMIIGGYVGAHVIVKSGNIWIKRIFLIFVITSALRLFII